MPKSLEEQIKELEEKQAKVKAQLKQKKAAAAKKKRQEDTRKKILIGSAILAKVKAGTWHEDKMLAMMDEYLDKEMDRALFGLDSTQEPDDNIDFDNPFPEDGPAGTQS